MRFYIGMVPKIIALILCNITVCCCQTTTNIEVKYFDNPHIAVEKITVMLLEKNWTELTKYYDLVGSKLNRKDLNSGKFFYTELRPEVTHPGDFWKYKHPFAPGFKFKDFRELEETDLIEVTVCIEIDQGGGMIQRGLQTFLMVRSNKGYQVKPIKEQMP